MHNFKDLKTPCYIINEKKIIENLTILESIIKQTGVKILLAQKAFSCYHLYPLIAQYLHGTTASGLHEARLGKEYFEGEVHVFSPAYKEEEFKEITSYASHIVFNSINQYQKMKPHITHQECGIRINPEKSTQKGTPLYDPASPYSRLGSTKKNLPFLPPKIKGLHFHTLCQQDAKDLALTLKVVEKNFKEFFSQIQWINFGGGHHITKEGYNKELLVKILNHFKKTYPLQVYLEPGEAIALNGGYLQVQVLDIFNNKKNIAIIDSSAACHMPDVLEMPYQPEIVGAKQKKQKGFPYSYRIGGNTCLAGDIVGDYFFEKPLKVGDKLLFKDMAIYTMVKNNTFNGVNLPDIILYQKDNSFKKLQSFGYQDFKNRL